MIRIPSLRAKRSNPVLFLWIAASAFGLLAMTTVAHAAARAPVPFQQNSGTPIDISADALEVQQEKNLAIFTGHVVAIQGDVRLTSEKMVVHYREQDKEEKKKQVKADAQQNGIERIEVERDVFLTTPTETARGATGVYDVEKQLITMDGGVVLTKDKNTLKGDHLVYSMATGKSTITSGNGQPAAGDSPKQRVRALFIPDKNDKKEEAPEAVAPKKE